MYILLVTIVTQCINFSNRNILDVKKHSDITTGVLFWSPAGRWIVHHLTCPQSDFQSPKVSHPIRISHFFPEANSQKHLTSKLKRKEPNWSLPAAAPLPIYHAPTPQTAPPHLLPTDRTQRPFLSLGAKPPACEDLRRREQL